MNQVLEQSRLEAGGVALNAAPFDLGALVRQLVEDQQPLARKKDLALAALVDPRLPGMVIGDATKLGQVLGNLVGNALKFTEAGSVLARGGGDERHRNPARRPVRVVDTGIGIPPARCRTSSMSTRRRTNAAATAAAALGSPSAASSCARTAAELQRGKRPGTGSMFWFDLELARP